MTPRFLMGVDLGQMGDYTAIAVAEQKLIVMRPGIDNHEEPNPFLPQPEKLSTRLEIRYLKRMQLGTGYVDIVRHIAQIMEWPEIKGDCALIVDATGVGRPVIDIMRSSPFRLAPIPVTLHGGTEPSQSETGYKVPKREVITDLLVLYNAQRLKILRSLEDAKALENELKNFRMRITRTAHETYGAWRDRDHDDLVLALALIAWYLRWNAPWEQQARKPMKKKRVDWDPLRMDEEEEELFNPLTYGGWKSSTRK